MDDISGSDSGIKDIDSNKCIDGIPYEFINGNKFEKNANHPEEPREISDFTVGEIWTLKANDSLFIKRDGYEPAEWYCENGKIQGIVFPGFINYHFSAKWSFSKDTLNMQHVDFDDNNQKLKTDSLTNSTMWLNVHGKDKVLKFVKSAD